jgi:hypothetical protein
LELWQKQRLHKDWKELPLNPQAKDYGRVYCTILCSYAGQEIEAIVAGQGNIKVRVVQVLGSHAFGKQARKLACALTTNLRSELWQLKKY